MDGLFLVKAGQIKLAKKIVMRMHSRNDTEMQELAEAKVAEAGAPLQEGERNRGRVKILPPLEVGVIGVGECFGDICSYVLPDRRSPFSFTTITAGTEVYFISQKDMGRLFSKSLVEAMKESALAKYTWRRQRFEEMLKKFDATLPGVVLPVLPFKDKLATDNTEQKPTRNKVADLGQPQGITPHGARSKARKNIKVAKNSPSTLLEKIKKFAIANHGFPLFKDMRDTIGYNEDIDGGDGIGLRNNNADYEREAINAIYAVCDQEKQNHIDYSDEKVDYSDQKDALEQGFESIHDSTTEDTVEGAEYEKAESGNVHAPRSRHAGRRKRRKRLPHPAAFSSGPRNIEMEDNMKQAYLPGLGHWYRDNIPAPPTEEQLQEAALTVGKVDQAIEEGSEPVTESKQKEYSNPSPLKWSAIPNINLEDFGFKPKSNFSFTPVPPDDRRPQTATSTINVENTNAQPSRLSPPLKPRPQTSPAQALLSVEGSSHGVQVTQNQSNFDGPSPWHDSDDQDAPHYSGLSTRGAFPVSQGTPKRPQPPKTQSTSTPTPRRQMQRPIAVHEQTKLNHVSASSTHIKQINTQKQSSKLSPGNKSTTTHRLPTNGIESQKALSPVGASGPSLLAGSHGGVEPGNQNAHLEKKQNLGSSKIHSVSKRQGETQNVLPTRKPQDDRVPVTLVTRMISNAWCPPYASRTLVELDESRAHTHDGEGAWTEYARNNLSYIAASGAKIAMRQENRRLRYLRRQQDKQPSGAAAAVPGQIEFLTDPHGVPVLPPSDRKPGFLAPILSIGEMPPVNALTKATLPTQNVASYDYRKLAIASRQGSEVLPSATEDASIHISRKTYTDTLHSMLSQNLVGNDDRTAQVKTRQFQTSLDAKRDPESELSGELKQLYCSFRRHVHAAMEFYHPDHNIKEQTGHQASDVMGYLEPQQALDNLRMLAEFVQNKNDEEVGKMLRSLRRFHLRSGGLKGDGLDRLFSESHNDWMYHGNRYIKPDISTCTTASNVKASKDQRFDLHSSRPQTAPAPMLHLSMHPTKPTKYIQSSTPRVRGSTLNSSFEHSRLLSMSKPTPTSSVDRATPPLPVDRNQEVASPPKIAQKAHSSHTSSAVMDFSGPTKKYGVSACMAGQLNDVLIPERLTKRVHVLNILSQYRRKNGRDRAPKELTGNVDYHAHIMHTMKEDDRKTAELLSGEEAQEEYMRRGTERFYSRPERAALDAEAAEFGGMHLIRKVYRVSADRFGRKQ